MTGVRYASCQITATDGTRNGSIGFDVTGTTRIWDGDVSTDWQTDGNWAAGLVPATADSVSIPTGVPFFPALTQNVVIGGVEVADGATLTLGSFGLTANMNVATGSTPGSGILGGGPGILSLAGTGTVRGRVPSLLVTGAYALSGDLFVVATGHGMMGMTLGAVTGELVATLVADERDEIPAAFRPARFRR